MAATCRGFTCQDRILPFYNKKLSKFSTDKVFVTQQPQNTMTRVLQFMCHCILWLVCYKNFIIQLGFSNATNSRLNHLPLHLIGFSLHCLATLLQKYTMNTATVQRPSVQLIKIKLYSTIFKILNISFLF